MKRFPVIICLVLLLLLVSSVLASPEISRISPTSGPNTGTITITITGSNFNDVDQVQLNKCKAKTGTAGGTRYGTIVSKSATSITAEFTLAGMNVGDYDIAVRAPFGGTTGDFGVKEAGFKIYAPSASSGNTGTTTTTTTTVKTYATESDGENSVFFDTSPSGATIYVDGSEVGTSAFTYKTDMDGSHTVLVKKVGYADYEDRVNILEGQRVRFYAQLTPLSSDTGTATTTKATTTVTGTGKPGKTTTANIKSTMKMPTPLGTDPPATEESPVDPAAALWAVAFAFTVVVIRRR